jgi:hypothetical protein
MKSLSTYKPSISDIVRAIVDSVLVDLNVCLPAKIVAYDKETQYADVQIQIMQTFTDGSAVLPPVIPNVPVKHPRARGGATFIHMPLQPGDDVTLVFSQRSLDNWKSQGGATNPQDIRKHHITDAYALIGGSAMPDSFSPKTSDAIEIVNGESFINVFPDGTFNISNGTNDLIQLVQEGFQTLSEDTTNTMLGPQPLNSFETYAEIAEKVQTLEAQ